MDWVVNNETYGLVSSLPNATQQGLLLTVPKFWSSTVDPTVTSPVPGYSYPEQDEGQLAYAVRGHLQVSPGTWAAGSVFRFMARIVVKPIEYDTAGVGVPITDANYSLFTPQFANERYLWQQLVWARFDMGSQPEVLQIRWKGACRIGPDEALWLFLENQSGLTQTLNFNPFLRTLMRADE